MEDSRIIELYWQRNPNAIAETEQKYGAYCFRVADNILKSREDSEECVNDTWLRAWNVIPPKRPEVLQMFLAKITRSIAFNRFEARTAGKRGGGETALVLEELSECIAGSSDPEREGNVFVRRCFFNETIEEIGKRYGLTKNHTAVILSRTRKKLRTHLMKEGYISEMQ